MSRFKLGKTGVALLAGAALIALAASTFVGAPLARPAPFRGEWPLASPPDAMRVHALSTGMTHRSAGFAYRGGSFFDKRDFSMSALLVEHPRGDVLIDAGFGREVDAHLQQMPFWFRAITRYTRTRSVREQLDGAHYDVRKLRAVLLTHAHWDHASGLSELREVPVWVTAQEHAFVRDGGWLSAVARQSGARFEEYEFDDRAYLGFEKSRDVYDDGSIVIVPAPGHTNGSVIVFLTLPSGTHYAMLGDLVWQREGVMLREERPWLARTLGDADTARVREQILRVSALAQRFPDLRLVPAHDARAFSQIPTWR